MGYRALTHPVMIVTAVVYGLLFTVASMAGLFGIALYLLLALSLWRYSYRLLRFTAQGRKNIPAPDIESMNPVDELYLVFHFIAFPAAVTSISIYRPFGLLLDGCILLSLCLLFPASAAVMGLTGSLAAAFDPRQLRDFFRAVGRDYVPLTLACLALLLVLWVLRLPAVGVLSGAVLLIGQIWLLLAVFAVIGSAVYAHQNEIDIPGIADTAQRREEEDRYRQWRGVLDQAYTSIRSGYANSGYEHLKKLIRANEHSWLLYYWLFENMSGWEEPDHALNLGREMIKRHISDNDTAGAFDLLLRCRRLKLQFHPGEESARALAAYALATGREGIASELTPGSATPAAQ